MQELSTNKQKQKDTTSPDVTTGESSRTPAVMETLAKSRDQEVAARQQEELHGINPLEGGTDSNKFLDKVSKREQRPPWLKPWDHVSWDNITNKEKVGRKDTINLFAEEVQKCIDNMQNNATTDQVKIGTDYTVEQFKDRVTTYREKLAQYKSGAIDATTSDERLIYYNMLAMISNLTRRLEWKLKKASKDESRIPESIRKKAYKQFKESFKSETPDYNAFFTIREAADEEIARTAKFNFLGDISIRDLKQRTKKYYNGIELFNEDAEALGNTIMDGSYSKLEPDQRKKRIEKFVQQSEDVFKYAEELRALSSSPKAAKQLQEIGTPSRSEVHRTLPRVGTLSEYNVHFKDIEEKHITDALRVLRRGYDTARGNTKCTSLMKFVLKHSKTMSLYGQALKEMEDFYSLWRDEKKELASQKWKQWEQRSQGDLRDADIAALATNAIGEYTLARGKRHEVPQDLSLDMSKIHPLEDLMKWYNERAPQHWDRIVQLPPYNGEFEGFKGDEALKRFYSRLDTHTQNLIKDANIFRAVKPQALYDLLENRIEKLPTTMVNQGVRQKGS